jgi:hypothetical protein
VHREHGLRAEGEKVSRSVTSKIEAQDFCFENSLVKIMANRACSEIKLGGLSIGPFEEGNEYETYFWVAVELDKSGIARFREEEQMDAAKLNKIQWTERVQTPGQISRLPEDFYPKVRRYLAKLKADILRDPEKIREHEKARQLAQDIVNSRLKKVISIASATAQTENTLRNFADEEKFLYEKLVGAISQWKTRIIECQEGRR